MSKQFILNAPFTFEENEEGKLEGKFTGIAYSGKAIEQYGWMQNLVIDLSDIRFKKSVPVLKGHHHDQIAGKSKLKVVDNQLEISGNLFRQSPHAAEIKSLAEDGFEWELSVGLGPEVKMTRLDEGVEMMVNGKKIKGPANILSKAHVSEVSFVAIGADRSASANVFKEKKEGDLEMSKEEKTNKDDKVEAIQLSTQEWDEIALACGCKAGASKEDVKATAKKKQEEMEAKIAKLEAELKKYKAADKKKDLKEAAEGKVTLSEEKIESLIEDEVKFEAYMEFLKDVDKKEEKKKIDAKFAEKKDLKEDDKTKLTFSTDEERKSAARKMVEEGKFKNFAEAIASLPEEVYKK